MKTRASLKTLLKCRIKSIFPFVSGIFFASIILLALIGTASATTYYVRNDGNNVCNGLYNNGGTSGNCAFKTIAYGLSKLVPGDTLRVQQGTYNEGGLSVPSGNAANWVTVKGDGNPIINAAAIYGFSHTGGNSYIIIEGFTIQGSDAGYYQSGGEYSNIIIRNNKFKGGVLYITGLGYGQDILIKGNDFSGQISNGGTTSKVINVGAAANPKFKNIMIDGNNIHDVSQTSQPHGIQFDGINTTVKNNIINSVSKCITNGGGKNIGTRILNNTIMNCVRGIRVDYDGYNQEIAYNTLINAGGTSWGMDLYPWRGSSAPQPYQFWIHDNIIDNTGVALYTNNHDIIENNTFRNGAAGISVGGSAGGGGNHIIRNNTFVGKGIQLISNIGNNIIENNRFYDHEGDFRFCGFICWAGGSGSGLYIRNNDFYNTNGKPAIATTGTTSSISQVEIKNNIFHTVSSALSDSSNAFTNPSINYNLVYQNSNSAFGGKTSFNTINQDPLFADPTGGDLHLKSQGGRWTPTGWVIDSVASSAIDAGDPSSVYSKEPAPNGGRINMGSYGNSAEASKSGSGQQPYFDFSLSNPGSITVTQGISGSNNITASLVLGSTQAVTFSASELPSGTTSSFSGGKSCNPTCSKTLTISTSTTTPSGTYPITVSVTNGAITKTKSFNLVVSTIDTTTANKSTYQYNKTLVISNIVAASGEAYALDSITIGKLQYIDRTYTFGTMPSSYNGLKYIKTANGDKASMGSVFLEFDVNQDVTVYVSHDDRITPKPAWLSSFKDSGDNLEGGGGTFSLYAKNFSAGHISLGGNSGSSSSMYNVVVASMMSSSVNNSPPVLEEIGSKTTNEGQTLTFTVSATDADGDVLTYTASNLPAGATFDPATRTFQWMPDFTQAGTYPNMQFRVSDGTLTALESITIIVNNVNRSLIITNVNVSSGKSYVVDTLATGMLQYIDRTYTFSGVPSSYTNLKYIRTANNDKASTGSVFLEFDVNQDVTVYVAHDDRITPKPAWLSSFTDSGDELAGGGGTFSLYAKKFSAGHISLGGNSGSGYSMYNVILKSLTE